MSFDYYHRILICLFFYQKIDCRKNLKLLFRWAFKVFEVWWRFLLAKPATNQSSENFPQQIVNQSWQRSVGLLNQMNIHHHHNLATLIKFQRWLWLVVCSANQNVVLPESTSATIVGAIFNDIVVIPWISNKCIFYECNVKQCRVVVTEFESKNLKDYVMITSS